MSTADARVRDHVPALQRDGIAGRRGASSRPWTREMFPAPEPWPRSAERVVREGPQMGDISCRSALTMHRGTALPASARGHLGRRPVPGRVPVTWRHDIEGLATGAA